MGGEGERGNKGPSLIVGVTFCMSGDPVPARPVPASPSRPRVLTWLPGTQLIASPYLETLLDFDGVYLGGQLTTPFLLPLPPIHLLPYSQLHSLPRTPCKCGCWWEANMGHFSESRWVFKSRNYLLAVGGGEAEGHMEREGQKGQWRSQQPGACVGAGEGRS